MDSLSQVVLGAAACHVVVGKKLGRGALVLGAVVGTLPDLDVFINFGDVVKNVTYHRSFTHSLFMLTLFSPLLTVLLWQWKKIRKVSFRRLLFAVWLALVTHPLLDGFTVYGTQLYWPLPYYPSSWSSVFIIDPMYTLPLLITMIMAFFKPFNVKLSYIGLTLSSVYLAWGMWAKFQVEYKVKTELARQGISYQYIKTVPASYHSLLWRIIAMDDDRYYESYASIFDKQQQALPFSPYLHNKHWLEPIKNNWTVQRLQWFTRGLYKVSVQQEQLIISDLRMGFEGSYVFNFAVADTANLNAPYVPYRVGGFYNPDAKAWMWKRILKPLPPFGIMVPIE